MDNVCNRCLFSIPSKVEMAEEQEYLLWIMSPSKRSLSPPSSVEIKPGYPASMKLILSLPTIMSKCCFFIIIIFLQLKCLLGDFE